MKHITNLFLILFLTLMGCVPAPNLNKDNPGGEDEPDEPGESSLVYVKLAKATNPNLKADIDFVVAKNNNMITAYLRNKVDTKSLILTFETKNSALFKGATQLESGKSVLDLSSPLQITVKGDDGKTKEYILNLIPYTGLPVVTINTPDGKSLLGDRWKSPIVDKDTWVEGTIQIDGMGVEDDYMGGLEVRGRGNVTWKFPKASFNCKLQSKDKILGMPQHKRWCFIGNWRDRSLLRNDVSLKIGSLTNLKWTPSCKPVELIFNGEHMGNYFVTEHIRVDENRVNIDEMIAGDIELPRLSGGYLLEMDQYYDEDPKFRTKEYDMPVMIKSPDADDMGFLPSRQMEYISTYLDQMEAALKAHNFKKVYEYLDQKTFIDFWLVNALVGNTELVKSGIGTGAYGPYSTYCYKEREGKLFAGPLWDFDNSALATTEKTLRSKTTLHLTSWWYNDLFKDPSFVSAVKSRFAELKPQLQVIPGYIKSQSDKMSLSAMYNWKLWPIDVEKLYGIINGDETFQEYKESTDRMVEIFNARLMLLETTINGL